MKSHGGPTSAVPRDSSIELFRIVTMMVIVAHHYIVNSGVIDQITQQNATSGNALFALLFGWGGKTGINCFVLITGYFMCASQATVRKFVKLLFEVLFTKLSVMLHSGYCMMDGVILSKTQSKVSCRCILCKTDLPEHFWFCS